MPDALTLILTSMDDCLRVADRCGFRAGPVELFGLDDQGRGRVRQWVDLTRPGQRYGSYATGPDWVPKYRGGYVHDRRFKLRIKLTTDAGAPLDIDPPAVASRLHVRYEIELRREGVAG